MTNRPPQRRTFRALLILAAIGVVGFFGLRVLRDSPRLGGNVAPPAQVVAPLAPPTPSRPAWMQGVVAVAVAQPDGKAVALLGLDEAGGSGLLARGFDGIGAMDWSPDGQRLAFSARRGGNWDVFVVSRSGGEPTRLTNDPAFDGWPAWSPDGTRLAFESARDVTLAVYDVAVDSNFVSAIEITRRSPEDADGPAMEPVWSPDGQRLVYAIWDGNAAVYRLDALDVSTGAIETLIEPQSAIDRRAPAFSPDGALVYREAKYGEGAVKASSTASRVQSAPNGVSRLPDTLASQAYGYSLAPGGDAIAFVSRSRWSGSLEIRGLAEPGRSTIARLGSDARHVAWAAGVLPAGLPAVEPMAEGERAAVGRGGGVASASLGVSEANEEGPPLVRINDIDVSGPRINARLLGDFEALRAEINADTGRDFLGTLSDMWRPLGFNSSRSAFYSWHKTGRAFDTFMSFSGPGGGNGMVLVREGNGRPMWRMYLRASVQDGSVGEPLREPGWRFSTSGWEEESELREGGSRALRVPGGYWVDFTAAAGRYGWNRIPAIRRSGFDWRDSFSAIEYWHYERRDGLSWRQAIGQIYEPDEINEALRGAPRGRRR